MSIQTFFFLLFRFLFPFFFKLDIQSEKTTTHSRKSPPQTLQSKSRPLHRPLIRLSPLTQFQPPLHPLPSSPLHPFCAQLSRQNKSHRKLHHNIRCGDIFSSHNKSSTPLFFFLSSFFLFLEMAFQIIQILDYIPTESLQSFLYVSIVLMPLHV